MIENKEIKAWIIADATCALDATYYCRKNIWSKDRIKAKIFNHKKEADDIAIKLDSNVWEISIVTNDIRPFTVIAWSKW